MLKALSEQQKTLSEQSSETGFISEAETEAEPANRVEVSRGLHGSWISSDEGSSSDETSSEEVRPSRTPAVLEGRKDEDASFRLEPPRFLREREDPKSFFIGEGSQPPPPVRVLGPEVFEMWSLDDWDVEDMGAMGKKQLERFRGAARKRKAEAEEETRWADEEKPIHYHPGPLLENADVDREDHLLK